MAGRRGGCANIDGLGGARLTLVRKTPRLDSLARAKRRAPGRRVTPTPDLRMYEAVINSIPDLVSVVSEDEVYWLVNDAWCRATGVRRTDAIGRAVSEILPAAITKRRRDTFRQYLESGRSGVLRDAFERPGGGRMHLETTYSPFPQKIQGRRCMALVTRDVTAEATAQAATLESQAQMRALLDAFPGYIASYDEGHRCTYVNERLAEVLGRPVDEIIGRTKVETLGPAQGARSIAEAEQALRSAPGAVERHFPATAAREQLYLEVRHVPGPTLPDGRRSYYSFGVDITERKLAQEAALAAKDEAERANRAKSRFLSLMSHELRTPMNAILGFAQLLLSDPAHPLTAEQQQYAGEILRGGRHLLGLINDVLDLSRIETGRLAISVAPVALLPLVEECLALMEPLARERPVHLKLGDRAALQCQVQADPLRLRQTLLNLLSNAIKYNRPDGDVTIDAQPRGEMVELRVIDTGIGITPDQVGRLFVAFERLAARRSGVEGTGIGLALSRQLVRAMGGEIGVDSELDRGSTFWIRLPRAARAGDPAAFAPAATPTAAARAQRERVLYVEDNPVNALLMQAMVARLPDVELEHAEDPIDAIARAQAAPPALLLLDIELPGIDGFELLKRLRSHERTRDIPAIAVSASAQPADIHRALKAGFAAYLTKPLDLTELLQAVQAHLHAQRSAQAG